MSYNGYKNWETWQIPLWFGNDEGLYHTVREYRGRFTGAKAKDFVLELMPDGTPDMRDLTPGQLHTAYGKVDWPAVARAFNDLKGD